MPLGTSISRSTLARPCPARAVGACVQALETRILLSGPSAQQQQMLELVNRFRTHPADELTILLRSTDSNVQNALSYFHVDRKALAEQWAGLFPQAPLAWNDALAKAADLHNQQMRAFDQQSHDLPGEANLIGRTAAAGYANASYVGENLFAYAYGVEHAHAGFVIDWGSTPTGIQDPAAHRDNLLAGVFREVGIAILDSQPGKSVGPRLVTQNFGARRDQANPYLLGTIYDDKNNDGAYTPGEGIDNVSLALTGKAGTFTTTSLTAGGYQLAVPPGVYTLTASKAGLGAVISSVTIGQDNVQRSFTRATFKSEVTPPRASLATIPLAVAGQSAATFDVVYSDDASLSRASINTGDVRITGPGGYSATPQLVRVDRSDNAPTLRATYRFIPADGFFDSADNGGYAIYLNGGQVTDTAGTAAGARRLGSFTVSMPQAVLTPSGTFVVNGTPGNDVITLTLAGSNLTARVNAGSQVFDYRRIRRIYVAGLAGNDSITMGRNIMGSTIDGGAGNDTLAGTDAADTLQGQDGNDAMYGYSGNDVFRYGAGKDRIFGGLGYDSAARDPLDLFDAVEALFV